MDILTLGKMNQLAKDLDQTMEFLANSTFETLKDVCDMQADIKATQTGQVTCLTDTTQTGIDALAAAGGGGNGTQEAYFYNPNSYGCACFQGNQTDWTVPAGTKSVTFEAWGGGGAGAGHCCHGCYCDMASCGSHGGYYGRKTLTKGAGDFVDGSTVYSICTGDGGNGSGTGCWTSCCDAPRGCASYVTGAGLTNFCAVGGRGGYNLYCGCRCVITSMRQESAKCQGMINGGNVDFAMEPEVGDYMHTGRHEYCRCTGRSTQTGNSYKLSNSIRQHIVDSTGHCGCINDCSLYRHAGGGMNSQKSYCGNWICGCQGTPGQPGLVVVTYS